MFGDGKGPKGTENPMEFLTPFIEDVADTRRRIVAAFDAMTSEAVGRGIGDAKRRAAIGYCFGGSNVIDLARAGADVQAVVSVHGVLATAEAGQEGRHQGHPGAARRRRPDLAQGASRHVRGRDGCGRRALVCA